MNVSLRRIVLLLILLFACPALTWAANSPALAPAIVTAGGITWQGFVDYWTSTFRGQHAALQIVTGVAILALAIIMLGYKWRK